MPKSKPTKLDYVIGTALLIVYFGILMLSEKISKLFTRCKKPPTGTGGWKLPIGKEHKN